MPISKKWKVVSGSVSMAVALGAGAAIAAEGGGEAPGEAPQLDDVVTVAEVGIAGFGVSQTDDNGDNGSQAGDASLESPFTAEDEESQGPATQELTPDDPESPESPDDPDSPDSPDE